VKAFVSVGISIFSSKLVFRIGAVSLSREGPSIWHGSSWALRGQCIEGFLGGIFSEVRVASSGSSDDDGGSELT
jgi:hypothetical protein